MAHINGVDFRGDCLILYLRNCSFLSLDMRLSMPGVCFRSGVDKNAHLHSRQIDIIESLLYPFLGEQRPLTTKTPMAPSFRKSMAFEANVLRPHSPDCIPFEPEGIVSRAGCISSVPRVVYFLYLVLFFYLLLSDRLSSPEVKRDYRRQVMLLYNH